MAGFQAWHHDDVVKTLAAIREKANKAHAMLLKAARPLLTYGTVEDARVRQ